MVTLGLLPVVWAQSPERQVASGRMPGVSGESATRPGWMEALSATRFDCRGHSFAFVHRVDRAPVGPITKPVQEDRADAGRSA